MKSILGILFMLGGIVVGLYVGLWVCFIGGILDIIRAFQPVLGAAGPNLTTIGLGLLKMILASTAGWTVGAFFFIHGAALLE